MKLYDETISKVKDLLGANVVQTLPLGESTWKDVTDNSMILRSDMAYELGAEPLPAVGLTLITDDQELVKENGVSLIGPDLPEIRRDVPYARIALVRVGEATLGEGNALYKAIRNLEYTRYHFYPEGFMMRVSAAKKRESVRIGKAALKQGLNFTKTGNRMISAFLKNPAVCAVQIVYVTDPGFDYQGLQALAGESEAITQTIDHMLKNAAMDCHVCSLQKICDEVEGLRQLHFNERQEDRPQTHQQ